MTCRALRTYSLSTHARTHTPCTCVSNTFMYMSMTAKQRRTGGGLHPFPAQCCCSGQGHGNKTLHIRCIVLIGSSAALMLSCMSLMMEPSKKKPRVHLFHDSRHRVCPWLKFNPVKKIKTLFLMHDPLPCNIAQAPDLRFPHVLHGPSV